MYVVPNWNVLPLVCDLSTLVTFTLSEKIGSAQVTALGPLLISKISLGQFVTLGASLSRKKT